MPPPSSTADALPRTLRVGILVFPDFEPLDVWGFVEAVSIARFVGKSYDSPAAVPFEVVLIANEDAPVASDAGPTPVKSFNGPRVAPDLYRDQALRQALDVFMVPGGHGVASLLADVQATAPLVAWIQAVDRHATLVTAVCTGAAILARPCLLDGRPAATNHQAFAWVTGFGPAVLWDNVSRWVDAGRYVTSAGVAAGTVMAWHLVSQLVGRTVAESAALAAEYDWHRGPEQPIFHPQQAAVPNAR